ncbi:MAG: serine/threonine protein kinase [Oscillatoria sp. SIO1A7]|nr:serine/threonine protein kinase [Oscillatoria sp. SIO1A7]
MKPVFCSKGHANPPLNRFCQYCGEYLSSGNELSEGVILGDRYRLVRKLGQGGFGITYLAQDINRFDELCVVKEFAPKVLGTPALTKAEELFEREAGILYKLQHPQIPKFRELCRCKVGQITRLFLVQSYIEGQNYSAILENRIRQGQPFAEDEAKELLLQLLPVLDYIHARGIIHRDISPDNLILRSTDQLPILIDFGGVKQLAARIENQSILFDLQLGIADSGAIVTRLGKAGYSPDEQLQQGLVYPHSDLYSLAVTVLVLLTGKEPRHLFDSKTLTWDWHNLSLSYNLGAVLKKMLAANISDRYQTAAEVKKAIEEGATPDLSESPTSSPVVLSTQMPPEMLASTETIPSESGVPVPGVLVPPEMLASTETIPSESGVPVPGVLVPPEMLASTETIPSESGVPVPEVAVPPEMLDSPEAIPSESGVAMVKNSRINSLGLLAKLSLFLATIVCSGAAGWWGGWSWISSRTTPPVPVEEAEAEAGEEPVLFQPIDQEPELSPDYTEEEIQRKSAMSDRRKKLEIDYDFFVKLVNEEFYEQYPQKRGYLLSTDPADEPWREQWDEVAAEILEKLATLSPSARRRLGLYGVGDRDRWKKAANQMYLSSNALYDLADAQFIYLFSNNAGRDISGQPIDQVWHAIAADRLDDLLSGKSLEIIRFKRGAFRHTIGGIFTPGSGKVYTAYLAKGQILRLSLQAEGATLLSIYTPSGEKGPLLNDSPQVIWNGYLEESGFYEIAIVSNASDPVAYTLDIAVDNISSDSN